MTKKYSRLTVFKKIREHFDISSLSEKIGEDPKVVQDLFNTIELQLSDNDTKMEEKVVVYTDGASRGNPGPAGIGVLVESPNGITLAEISEYIGKNTNNIAEYCALLEGLSRAKELGARSVQVKSDSELLVRQIRGLYRVKNKNLLIIFKKCMAIIGQFDHFTIDHIPRRENSRADKLANNAIDTANCNIE